jgi:hypothetical protein
MTMVSPTFPIMQPSVPLLEHEHTFVYDRQVIRIRGHAVTTEEAAVLAVKLREQREPGCDLGRSHDSRFLDRADTVRAAAPLRSRPRGRHSRAGIA